MNFKLTVENYRCFTEDNPLAIEMREGFSAFLGVNNSGKSSILKFFYEFRPVFDRLRLNQKESTATLLQGLHDTIGFSHSIKDPQEVFCNSNGQPLKITFDFPDISGSHPTYPLNKVILFFYRTVTPTCSGQFFFLDREFTLPNQSRRIHFPNDNTLPLRDIKIDFTVFFECLGLLHDTLYIGPFRNVINIGTNDSYFDIQVGQAFVKRWRELKTGSTKKENESVYDLTQSIKRVFGFRDLEINPSPNDDTLQIFVNGKSYKLVELGAGIAQFIMVLINAAIRNPSIILIDEPELNLHPSLQVDFLTALGSYASHSVLFCTHSVGLARATAENIYSVRMNEEFSSEVTAYEETPSLSEFLGELSFSEYRELGFNKVLLVEGVTEVKAMQQFLRALGKDHEVLLLPLGGNQLINKKTEAELEELKRISPHIFAVVDSEKKSAEANLPKDRKGFQDACKNVGIKCHVLERRATENYISEQAIKKVKGDKYKALDPFEKPDTSLFWGKSQNWKLIREMDKNDWIDTDLGKFLESI